MPKMLTPTDRGEAQSAPMLIGCSTAAGARSRRSGSGSPGCRIGVALAFTGCRHAVAMTRASPTANRIVPARSGRNGSDRDDHGGPTKDASKERFAPPKLDIRELRRSGTASTRPCFPNLSRELLIRAVAYRMQEVAWAVSAQSRSANCVRCTGAEANSEGQNVSARS